MDKSTDFSISSHQGVCGQNTSKIYYLQECSDEEKSDLVDQHRFRIFKDEDLGYSIESRTNQDMMLATDLLTTSVCLNNNSEVETMGNVVNSHVVSQGENNSFAYEFVRYYSKNHKLHGCSYESDFSITFKDMFGIIEIDGTVSVFNKYAENVDIELDELNIEWYVNYNKIDSLSDKLSAVFDDDSLRRYTTSDEALIYLIIDGVRFNVDTRFHIDRRDYAIKSVTQQDEIVGFDIHKKIHVDHNFTVLTESILFIDGSVIENNSIYNEDLVGKTITAVMYKKSEPTPEMPVVVGENGVVNIKESEYLEETVSAPYLNDGYFELSDVDGSISGISKSVKLPIHRITRDYQIKNYVQPKIKFFGTSKQLNFSDKIASLEDGNVSVKNELGNQEIYRMEDLIDTELVFEDKEEVYVFLSRSSFQDNTDWTINNIEDMTFEIDSGRIYGDNVDMTYDAGINEVRKISLTVLWLSLLAGSSMQIYGIKDDNSEVLLLEVRNNTSIESSIFK